MTNQQKLGDIQGSWLSRAEACERKRVEAQRIADLSSSQEQKSYWKRREDELFGLAKAYRQMAGAVAVQIASMEQSRAISMEFLRTKVFDLAHADFEDAKRELDDSRHQLEDRAAEASSDPELFGKLHRAIAGIRDNPYFFHFFRLHAPDLLVSVEVANSGVGMDGLNWPEDFRLTIQEAQRRLNRWRSALAALKVAYAGLTEAERLTHSEIFLF